MPLVQAAVEYSIDAWQRGILFADVLRERGNQYLEHLAQEVPHVLSFAYEPVVLGSALPRPVNYGLVRIIPPADVVPDPQRDRVTIALTLRFIGEPTPQDLVVPFNLGGPA